jgi:hypothetical protein
MLRRDIAQKLDREARVVFNDAIDFLDRLTLGPELDRAQLQAFHENIAGARRDAADIDPVDIDGEKADEATTAGTGVNWRIHHGVV